LKRPLELSDIKKKLVGHWGSAPGQNFIYVHLNRVINKYDLNMIYIAGPGHSGQAIVANTYLEGTYSEFYPDITEDEEGLTKLCRQFSFPGGIPSHVAPETPGSINEGGELGYSLSHAYGAILDNPNLIAACVIGDGEAETGPLATSWQINKLINPLTDGVVLPILHLNGFKIANPTILSRISLTELKKYFEGLGYNPYLVSGSDPIIMHEKMAQVMDQVILEIKNIKNTAKQNNDSSRPKWPMIILKTPKGWTGIKKYEGKDIENSFRSHQVPIPVDEDHIDNVKLLEKWLKSYHVDNLFDDKGRLIKVLRDLAPKGNKRMGSNPNTNGGLLLKELNIPDYSVYGLKFKDHGVTTASDMMVLGSFIRDIIKKNNNFRIFGPDEALSNRLNEIFKVTNREWNGEILENDEYLNNSGRIIDSILSEHVCEGLLEGYVLTGRHGFMHSYEAFIRIVDSMVSQHAKWLKVCNGIEWRKDISSLNFILTSHCWQQDHNGFTHQDPGFLNHLVTKKADISRIYLPIDANTLLSSFDHIIKTKNYINVIVASKHITKQWLNIDEAKEHCAKGLGIFEWASDPNPDLVLVSAGDTPNLEILAATQLLKENIPTLKIRVVNVIDLMKLISNEDHPHGLTNSEYNSIFTKDKPIIFAFHGYPHLIHQLTYKRFNQNMHVHGYIEEGTITTPFDMRVLNKLDRYHLVLDALKYVKVNKKEKELLIKKCEDTLKYHNEYIRENGVDIPEVVNFTWHLKNHNN
jgi:xylulose-5-phosphate/fructose-6-phosphate phosphoketolase